MQNKTSQQTDSSAGTPASVPFSGKTYAHEKPIFISLKKGASVCGVFLRAVTGRFGLQYRMKTDDGKIVYLSGGRYQLDAMMEDLDLSEDFAGGLRGHKIAVTRGEDVKLDSGQTCATYTVTHVLGCPQGCVSV